MKAASTVGLILLAGILGMVPASARNCWRHECDHYCHHSHGNCPDCAQYRSDTGRTTAQAAVQMETVQGKIAEINYLPAPNPDDAVVEVRLDRGSNATVVPPQIRRNVELWVGCVAGALTEENYRGKLAAAGFVEIDIEPARIYRIEDARQFLATEGVDVDAIAPVIDGKFTSAFIRARKP
jgi:hypothetical protein